MIFTLLCIYFLSGIYMLYLVKHRLDNRVVILDGESLMLTFFLTLCPVINTVVALISLKIILEDEMSNSDDSDDYY